MSVEHIVRDIMPRVTDREWAEQRGFLIGEALIGYRAKLTWDLSPGFRKRVQEYVRILENAA